ncbi:MAG: hypothetical protein AABX51_04015 [Nanoarchaeota archaeon]
MAIDYMINIKEGCDCSLEDTLASLKEGEIITDYYKSLFLNYYRVTSENDEFVSALEGLDCIESVIESPEYNAIDLSSQIEELNNN